MTFNAASRLRSLEDRSAALGSSRCELPGICIVSRNLQSCHTPLGSAARAGGSKIKLLLLKPRPPWRRCGRSWLRKHRAPRAAPVVADARLTARPHARVSAVSGTTLDSRAWDTVTVPKPLNKICLRGICVHCICTLLRRGSLSIVVTRGSHGLRLFCVCCVERALLEDPEPNPFSLAASSAASALGWMGCSCLAAAWAMGDSRGFSSLSWSNKT